MHHFPLKVGESTARAVDFTAARAVKTLHYSDFTAKLCKAVAVATASTLS